MSRKSSNDVTIVSRDMSQSIISNDITIVSSTPIRSSSPLDVTVVLYNSTYTAFAKRTGTSIRFHSLKYTQKLGEIGTGSVSLILPTNSAVFSTQNRVLLSQGSFISIIYKDYPVFSGVITKATTTNNNYAGRGIAHVMYNVSFSDSIKALAMDNINTIAAYSGQPIYEIFNSAIGEVYAGDQDINSTQKFSFTFNNQSKLDIINALAYQSGYRWRSRPRRPVSTMAKFFSDGRLYTGSRVAAEAGYSIFTSNEGSVTLKVTSVNTSDSMSIIIDGISYQMYRTYYTTNSKWLEGSLSSSPNGEFNSITSIKIDFRPSYYQYESVVDDGSFLANSTIFDFASGENFNQVYGKVSVTSPQSNGTNVTCTIPLNNVKGKDYTIQDAAYITESSDTKIADYQTNSTELSRYDVAVYGNVETAPVAYSVWYKVLPDDDDGQYAGKYRYVAIGMGSGVTTVHGYYDNTEATLIQNAFAKSADSGRDCIVRGAPLWKWMYTIDNPAALAGNPDIYIGGELIADYTVSGNTLTINSSSGRFNYPDQKYAHYAGTLIQYATPQTGSPAELYPDKTLAITVQPNYSYIDVEYLASTIARYGSNFSAQASGRSLIRDFTKLGGDRLLDVGDHISVTDYDWNGSSYGQVTHDYELLSYSISFDNMDVSYTMGMSEANIGKVLNNLKRNMSTNITTM